jgi:mannitol/fructose-specific phosphotransferase system IIA component (Ntr-type)/energy-converting hydrogenase Eha subunit A
MVPRGEVALIIAGIGLAGGILDQRLFGVTILMTLATTLIAPPILSAALGMPGLGTKKPVKGSATVVAEWTFPSHEIADLVVDSLLKDLATEGFYVQRMNIGDGISQARKGEIAISIVEGEREFTLETAPEDMSFVKTLVYEALVRLDDSVERLKAAYDPHVLLRDVSEQEGRADRSLFKLITPDCVCPVLAGSTKEEVIAELVDLLARAGKLADRELVLADVLAREASMSTGMQHGVALPHAKTDGVESMQIALGLKPEGVDFASIDGEPSRIFFLIASPKKISGPHVQFLSAVGSVLHDEDTRARLLAAQRPEEALAVLRGTR